MKLTDEHIVPYSLGGNILLPKSSCVKCQEDIHKFETHVSTNTYLSFRSAQRFPSRRKSLKSHLPVEFKIGPLKFEHLVPIDDAPVQSIIPTFGLPPYISGTSLSAKLNIVPIDNKRWKRTFMHCKGCQTASIISGGIILEYFVRLIMKISYGFTWLVDPECASNWHAKGKMLKGFFSDSSKFSDIFSIPVDREKNELFYITIFTDISRGHTELFCQLELLSGIKVPAYVCRMGKTQINHSFGIEFKETSNAHELGAMQLLIPRSSHMASQ